MLRGITNNVARANKSVPFSSLGSENRLFPVSYGTVLKVTLQGVLRLRPQPYNVGASTSRVCAVHLICL